VAVGSTRHESSWVCPVPAGRTRSASASSVKAASASRPNGAALTCLRQRCGLTGRLLGFVTENHGELFPWWRDRGQGAEDRVAVVESPNARAGGWSSTGSRWIAMGMWRDLARVVVAKCRVGRLLMVAIFVVVVVVQPTVLRVATSGWRCRLAAWCSPGRDGGQHRVGDGQQGGVDLDGVGDARFCCGQQPLRVAVVLARGAWLGGHGSVLLSRQDADQGPVAWLRTWSARLTLGLC
jgi:hypothetical protein